jgi:microcin C transport system permease protein
MDAKSAQAASAPDKATPKDRAGSRLSPINQRRWANFKANRRGFWSLWIFLILFFISIFAELIANEKPILVFMEGRTYVPVFVNYDEAVFVKDDPLDGFANFREPEVSGAIKQRGGVIIWPPIRYHYQTVNREIPQPAPSKPFWLLTKKQRCAVYDKGIHDAACTLGNMNWLGTDDQGRDVVARLIYGFRISVLFGLVLAIASSIIGVMAGAVQGYFGGWVDLVFQRVIEVWTSVPQLYLLIIIAAVIAPTFWILLGILLLFSWVALVGVVRAEFLRGRNFEYVTAARALGVSNAKIMFKHLLPNAMVATLTFLPFILNGSITTLTSLDFLGFGLPPGSPSLGELLAQGKANLQAPWLGFAGFFVIAIMLSLLVFIGEAVRDALDPRKTFQ